MSKPKPPVKPPKTEIPITEKTEAQKLLEKARATKPAKPEKIEKRGRPPKVKPDATLTKYKDHPLAVELDKMVCFALNATVTKKPAEQMKPSDTHIGEAFLYTGEYYGWRFFEHPIFIMILAIGGTVWTALQKREVKTEETPKAHREETA